jgi:hypothetical protein
MLAIYLNKPVDVAHSNHFDLKKFILMSPVLIPNLMLDNLIRLSATVCIFYLSFAANTGNVNEHCSCPDHKALFNNTTLL